MFFHDAALMRSPSHYNDCFEIGSKNVIIAIAVLTGIQRLIQYREIRETNELQRIVDMELAIWASGYESAVPHNMLVAIVHSGGMVIGADDGVQLVGFALALPARRPDGLILWSHMAGVLPSVQRQGIGLGLKLAQREWALAHDYSVIAWTFDPLQRGNANFNLRMLGGRGLSYHVNFYGDMLDGINAGMPSDRLEIVWSLHDPRVTQAAQGKQIEPLTTTVSDTHFLLFADEHGNPHPGYAISRPLTEAWYSIQIPYHIGALKRSDMALAKSWQIGLRQTMQTALSHGYVAVDFVTEGERCWYVMGKR
jgi:predicted GNAT superfamily acetyltransferase